MKNSLVIPAAVIGVAFIVFGAISGVAYLSGSSVLVPPPPANLAPLESPTPYAIGDLLQSANTSQAVIVTGYDASQDVYTYQPVEINFRTGDVHIMEGTGTMECGAFETQYPHRILMHS